jgi:glycosyltransferase involved in cell wall biosynthesis
MVKNEEETIINTLISVQNYINSLIIYDTGSTDNTIQVITDFCIRNNLILNLKQEDFINFGESRNKAIKFAETFNYIDYLLLMDSNDILDDGEPLLKLCSEKKDSEETGFYLKQEWYNYNNVDTYHNIRLIKPKKGWKYIGVVHEYIYNENETPSKNDYNIILNQDRSTDNLKSSKRYLTDKQLLLQSLENDPNNTRNIFYLAQTCFCLKEYDESFQNYLLRTTLDSGFNEEVFYSFIRCGDIIGIQGGNWYDAMIYYMKAYEIDQRAEPLVKIAQYYMTKEKWMISFSFLSIACNIEYPNNAMLFVDKYVYDYVRWHLLGAIAFYCGPKYKKQGKEACLKAIESMDRDIDKNNLKFYLD